MKALFMKMQIGSWSCHKEFTTSQCSKILGEKLLHGQRGTGFHEYALELSSKIVPSFTASPESAFKGQGGVECPEVERKGINEV